jgi:hypothetical protein
MTFLCVYWLYGAGTDVASNLLNEEILARHVGILRL